MIRTSHTRFLKLTMIVGILVVAAWVAPQPAAAGSCSAWQSCSDGSTVDCTGSNSCLVGGNYVECDGVRTTCPAEEPCEADLFCPSPPFSQQWYVFCRATSTSQSCFEGTDYVRCGSTTVTCQDCEDGKTICLSAGP